MNSNILAACIQAAASSVPSEESWPSFRSIVLREAYALHDAIMEEAGRRMKAERDAVLSEFGK